MDWFERAEEELDYQLEQGEITIKEFNNEMRNLHEEAEELGYFN